MLKDYWELLKPRLSFLVAFSSVFGYILGSKSEIDWKLVGLFWLSVGVAGAANTINQVKEEEWDKLMFRTQKRPIPTSRISPKNATIFAYVLVFISLIILYLVFNWYAAILSFLSFILYAYVYTPLKRKGTIAVFVGAFPGAFPPMIGWLAATGRFGLEPGILFAIQFFWQFPHFWAIAWVSDKDYKKAGFKLLPGNGKKDFRTAFQIMIYTTFLLPLSFAPYLLQMTGITSSLIALAAGTVFLAQTFYLMKEQSDKAARWIMFGSFIYLPVVQIAFLVDKI